jgi:histone H3/H4
MPSNIILLRIFAVFPQKVFKYTKWISFEVKNMADLPIAAVVRIAKKNGAERVGSDAAEALVAKAEKYIAQLTKEANKLAEHAGRKTIKKEDVDLASKSN